MTFIRPAKSALLKWLFAPALVIFIFSCADKDDPAPRVEEDNLVEATVTGSREAAELRFLIEVSGMDVDPAIILYDVDVYNVIYTTSYKGLEIEASGLVLLPKTPVDLPMISFQRGTTVRQSDAPSLRSKSSEEVISYAALASMGFITVVPDMIGFGESKEIFHPYYVEEPTATAVIDMLRAAATLAEEKQITFDNRLFLAGYSQGGYSTLATHKAIEAAPLEDFELIASFPGAGGYDITHMQKYLFALDTYPDPYYLAYVGLSYQSYYEEPGLLPDFFNEPYASRIPSLFDGLKSGSDINAQLTQDIQALVKADVLTDFETAPQLEALREKFEANSLINWTPTIPIYMYHGDADMTVPLENSVVTHQNLLDNGASPDELELLIFEGGNHGSTVLPYIADLIEKLQALK
jgi:pimeloyl-ACP methyl ester carboxylesterase